MVTAADYGASIELHLACSSSFDLPACGGLRTLFDMPIDPNDFTLRSHLVDAHRFSEIVNTALGSTRPDTFSALTTALDATSALRRALYPSSALLSSATPISHLRSAASSLASLRPAFQQLPSIQVPSPFDGTISALATLGSIGVGIQRLVETPPIPSALRLPELSLGAAAYQVGIADSLRLSRSVTSPYLGSSAAVFSLETSYSKLLTGEISGLSSIQSSLLPSYITSLRSDIFGLSDALKDTWASISGDINRLSVTTTPVLRAPAVELYTATQAAAVVSLPVDEIPDQDQEIEEIIDETVGSFVRRLAALSQALVTTYNGGNEALENGGTDWQRHSMVSFRELTTHALHMLAPDENVMVGANSEDLHNGRPTRRARLNHIFAEIAGPEIASFYEADMKAALALFDLLNDGTHRLEQHASAKQMHYLRGRVVGLVTSMLAARGF